MPTLVRRLTLSALTLALFAAAASAESAEELMAKNLAARGGKDKIQAIRSARISGKMTLGRGTEAPFSKEWRRPNLTRVEFTLMGMTGVQAYDGSVGWAIMPFHGMGPEPQKMTEAELGPFLESTDFDGPLVDPGKKGLTIELVGKEAIEGTPAFKLKLTRKNGDISFLYLDAETYLEIKEIGTSSVGGATQEFERTLSDYKTVRGVLFPFFRERKAKGAISGQATTIETIELDTEEPDARFKMPGS